MNCIQCGDIHGEWDDESEMNEPYFILGVCFFCRIEIEEENNKNQVISKMQVKEFIQMTNAHIILDSICDRCKKVERIRLKIGEELPKCSNCP